MPSIVEKEVRQLLCPLTDTELSETADLMAAKLQEAQSLEAELERVKRDFKAKQQAVDGAISLCAQKIRSKSVLREVDCAWTYDWEHGKKTLTRKDTGEVVVTETIRDFEHQRHFDDLKKDAEEKNANDKALKPEEKPQEQGQQKAMPDTCEHTECAFHDDTCVEHCGAANLEEMKEAECPHVAEKSNLEKSATGEAPSTEGTGLQAP